MNQSLVVVKKRIMDLVPRFHENEKWIRRKDVLSILSDHEKELREMVAPPRKGHCRPYVPLTVEALIKAILGESHVG